MKRIGMMSLACLLGVGSLLSSSQMYKNVSGLTAATLQSNNNFSQTCSNVSLSGTVLSASCKMDRGMPNQTSADISRCALGTIQNINGQLACDTGNNCPTQYGKPCCSLTQIPSVSQGAVGPFGLNTQQQESHLRSQLTHEIMQLTRHLSGASKGGFGQYLVTYMGTYVLPSSTTLTFSQQDLSQLSQFQKEYQDNKNMSQQMEDKALQLFSAFAETLLLQAVYTELQTGKFDPNALNLTQAKSQITQAQVQQLEQQIMEIVQKYKPQQQKDFIQYVYNYSLQLSPLPSFSEQGPTGPLQTHASPELLAQQFQQEYSQIIQPRNEFVQFVQQGNGLQYSVEVLAACALYLDQQVSQTRLYLPVSNAQKVLDTVKGGDFESAIQALQSASQQPDPRLGSRMQQRSQWQQIREQQQQMREELQEQQQILKQRMQQQQQWQQRQPQQTKLQQISLTM